MSGDLEALTRWRLVLGEAAEGALGCGLEGDALAMDAALAARAEAIVRDIEAGSG